MISTHTQYRLMAILNKVPFIYNIVQKFYHKFLKKNIEKRRNAIFRKNALNVLSIFHKCMEENNLYYTLSFGTLLGAVREKGFIKHDMDIDVVMWSRDYSNFIREALASVGFKLSHEFLVEEGHLGREETYTLNGVSIDIFYIYDNGQVYCCDFLTPNNCPTFQISMQKFGYVTPRRLFMPFKYGRHLSPFENIMLYIPDNAVEFLEFRYGKDYMIPKKNWGIKSYDKYIVVWTDKKAMFYDYE